MNNISASYASSPSAAIDLLERGFSNIEKTRMQDIPILNPALKVRAVGFEPWQDFYLGVMLTPWFLNCLLLPRRTLHLPKVGSTITLVLPGGEFEFLSCYERAIGAYLSCSLLSPVTEFSNQQLAVDTARAALVEISQNATSAQYKTDDGKDSPPNPERRNLFTRFRP